MPPSSLRVAMVVTKAPSEPFSIVRTTLEAMLAQGLPHDTWLADEAPTPETIAWAEANGVRISTRFGVEDYHQAAWPRRSRCKEGNLAYFYDHYGYELYDVVVQLDADHVPEPGYLEAMVRPFADPKVGYVSAPSICDSNARDSSLRCCRAIPGSEKAAPIWLALASQKMRAKPGITSSALMTTFEAEPTLRRRRCFGLGPS